jgi:hypothetical protein
LPEWLVFHADNQQVECRRIHRRWQQVEIQRIWNAKNRAIHAEFLEYALPSFAFRNANGSFLEKTMADIFWADMSGLGNGEHRVSRRQSGWLFRLTPIPTGKKEDVSWSNFPSLEGLCSVWNPDVSGVVMPNRSFWEMDVRLESRGGSEVLECISHFQLPSG